MLGSTMLLPVLAAATEAGSKPVSAGVNHQATFQHLGEMVPEDVNEFVEEFLDKVDEVEVGPLDLYLKLVEDEYDFSQLPVINSTKGNNPHKFKYINDRNREVNGDAFKFIYIGTPAGKALNGKLLDCELAMSTSNSHQSKIYADKVGNELFLKDEKKVIKARLDKGGDVWRKAAAIDQMIKAFSERVDAKKCKADFYKLRDAKGEEYIRKAKRPFIIGDPSTLGNSRTLTINEFIDLDLDKGLANGGSYQAILATLEKGANTTRTDKFKINRVEDVFAMLSNMGQWLDPGTKEGRARLEVMRKMTTGDNGDANLLAYGSAVIALDCNWTELEKPYNTLSAATRTQLRDKAKTENKTAATAA